MIDNEQVLNYITLAILDEHPVVIKVDGTVSLLPPIPLTLSQLQELVGGDIEYIPTTPDIVAYCNDEGRLQGLKTNVIASLYCGVDVVGPVVVIPAQFEDKE